MEIEEVECQSETDPCLNDLELGKRARAYTMSTVQSIDTPII
jgi:hypothetical protein